MRSSTSQMTAAITQPVIYSLALVRLDFDSGTVAWNSGFSPIVFNGATYAAAGDLTNISAASEAPGMAAASISVGLSGIKPEIVSMLLSEPYLGRMAYIYHAIVAEDLVFDPLKCKQIFSGKMDSISGEMGATASFSISIKSRLADWERNRNLMYTDSDQQAQYPGDKFMEYIPQISQMKLLWPLAKALPDPRD